MKTRFTAFVIGCIGILVATSSSFAQQVPSAPKPAVKPTTTAPSGPAPRLVLSTTEWNFGTKWYGEPCSTEVTLTNKGDATLEILNVRSSCGCTVAKPKKRKLAPGESDVMSIRYNTRKNRKIVSQTITLETNDPTQPRVPILVKGEVKQILDAKPANRITFTRIERETAVTQTVELRNNLDEKLALKIKSISNASPFDIKLETIEEGTFYKLSATTKPPLKLGPNTAEVVLSTGVEKFPTITIPVNAYVAPRVAVTPRRLYVSPRVSKQFQRIVRITYRPDKPVKITEIKTSHPDLIKAELMEPKTSNRPIKPRTISRFHQIKVTLPAGKDMPNGGGWIEIHTDDPSPEYQKFVVDVVLRKAPTRAINRIRRGRGSGAKVERPVKSKVGPGNTAEKKPPATPPATKKKGGEASPD